jgi:ELWxxDGT repeat protein
LGASVRNIFNFQGTMFFSADDGIHGEELWKSDGAAGGAVLIKDILPGLGSSRAFDFTAVNNILFFTADDGVNGRELWRTDGTSAGTVLVKNIDPGTSGFSGPSTLTNFNGTLFFRANDGVHGYELWKSNGTASGTKLVKDINPGLNSSNPFAMSAFGNVLIFEANDGVRGYELWRHAPILGGFLELTELLKDINPGPDDSNPNKFTRSNGVLMFEADDGVHGRELWKTNGTTAGTILVSDVNIGPGDSSPRDLVNVNGILFFSADKRFKGRELFRSNGTAAGTSLVKDINVDNGNSDPDEMVNVNGTLFFEADDGTHGKELWKSDGSEAGTVLIRDIVPGLEDSYINDLFNVSGTLFFRAEDLTHGRELWTSDGTSAGTLLVKDLLPGILSSGPREFAEFKGQLAFTASDGIHGSDELFLLGPVVFGTAAADTITVEVTGFTIVATVNNQQRVFNRTFGGLSIDARGGVDSIVFLGATESETGTIRVNSAELQGPGYVVDAISAEGIKLDGRGGIDQHIIDTKFSATQVITADRDDSLNELILTISPQAVHRAKGFEGELQVLFESTRSGGTRDTIDLSLLTLSDLQSLGFTKTLVDASQGVATIIKGTAGIDTVIGSPGGDLISGFAGNDSLDGRDGNDELRGGNGNDSLFGGNGDDQLFGEDGNDILDGGPGNNLLDEGSGQGGAIFRGTAGDDVIRVDRETSPAGAVAVFWLNGRRSVNAYRNGETIILHGGNGDDRMKLIGTAAEVWEAKFFGDGGDDVLQGGNLADELHGGSGDDRLLGFAGADQLFGDGGSDRLWGGFGDDYLNGGTGNDKLFGERGNDLLLGGAGNDWLFAGLGNDLLLGGAGRDRLFGGADEDLLLGDTTDFENDRDLLAQAANAWSSPDAFTTRISTLRSAVPAARIHDDGQNDILVGGGGRDWLLDLFDQDILRGVNSNPNTGDVIN